MLSNDDNNLLKMYNMLHFHIKMSKTRPMLYIWLTCVLMFPTMFNSEKPLVLFKVRVCSIWSPVSGVIYPTRFPTGNTRWYIRIHQNSLASLLFAIVCIAHLWWSTSVHFHRQWWLFKKWRQLPWSNATLWHHQTPPFIVVLIERPTAAEITYSVFKERKCVVAATSLHLNWLTWKPRAG